MTKIAETGLLLATSWSINTVLNLFGYCKRKWPQLAKLDQPLDFHRSLGKDRILGKSTTLLGLLIALISGLALSKCLNVLGLHSSMLGGTAVYFGHALGSFIKRRLHIPQGQFAPIIDHADSVVTLGVLYFILDIVRVPSIILAMVLSILLQPILCYVGYRLHIREHPL